MVWLAFTADITGLTKGAIMIGTMGRITTGMMMSAGVQAAGSPGPLLRMRVSEGAPSEKSSGPDIEPRSFNVVEVP